MTIFEDDDAQRDARIVEYHERMYGSQAEDVWAEEPEDVCRGCGAPHVSHARTPSDEYCPECRFGRGA